MPTDSREDWTETQQASLVTKILSNELTVQEACQKHALSPERIRDWVLRYRRSARTAFDHQLIHTLASQGLDAAELHAAEFTGALADIPITDLLQTLALARKDGIVTVSHRGEESRIWCVAGEIVDAESGRLTGEHAVYRIVALEQGQVRADLRTVPRPRVVHASMSALLLEALRRKDEATPLRRRLGDEGLVYCQAPQALEPAIEAPDLQTLRLFSLGCTVGQAVASGERGDLETLQAVVRLVDQGHLVRNELLTRSRLTPLPAEPVPGSMPVSSLLAHVLSGSPARPRPRNELVAIALLATAGLVGALLWWPRTSPGSLASVPGVASRAPGGSSAPAAASADPGGPAAAARAALPAAAEPIAPVSPEPASEAGSSPPSLDGPALVPAPGDTAPVHRTARKSWGVRKSARPRSPEPAAPAAASATPEPAPSGAARHPNVAIITEREFKVQVIE